MNAFKTVRYVAVMALASIMQGQALADTTDITAKLARVEGNVMVNQGVNYSRAVAGTALKTGSKVITAKGASVALVYKDGCVRQLKENSILTVGPATECTTKKVNERIYLAEALGDTGTDAPPAGAGSMGGGGGGFLGGISPGMIVGGLAIIGGAVAVSGHSDHNASPQ